MSRLLKWLVSNLGFCLAVGYGVGIRVLYGTDFFEGGPFAFTLDSIAFIWYAPIALGCFSLVFSPTEKLKSFLFCINKPCWAVLGFLLVTFATGLEDLICISIFSFPFLGMAALGGLLTRWLVLNSRTDKRGILPIALLPFAVGIVENQVETPVRHFEVTSRVQIDAAPGQIWPEIIRVRPIAEQEYSRGFFNWLGIPRPLEATLTSDSLGAIRIGQFEGGLRFIERVTLWVPNEAIAFSIELDDSAMKPTPFSSHILTNPRFGFEEARYQLIPVSEGRTELKLTSRYRLQSKTGSYTHLWGDAMLQDFQNRLLRVVQARCEVPKN